VAPNRGYERTSTSPNPPYQPFSAGELPCAAGQDLGHNTRMAATRRIEDARLKRLSKICLALPEAVRKDMGSHAAFLVRNRTFSYFLNDHHGDGIVSVTCKVLPGDNSSLATAQPERFYLPAYIGPKGWVALRNRLG